MAIQTKAELKSFINTNIDTNGTNSITGAQLNSILTDLVDSLTIDTDLTDHENDLDNPHDVGKADVGLSNVPNTDFTNTKFNLSELDVTDLGTNPTAWDMSSRKVAVAKAVITSGVTITKSNDSNLRSVELWLDNTNDNTIVMAGFDFKGSLPDGVVWTLGGSTLVFTSADGEYQILGSKNPLTSGLIICNIQKVD